MAANSRVFWRCRRGIRELDMVFANFLDQHYDTLSAEDNVLFDSLLLENDLDIYDWMLGRQTPPADYLGLLALLHPPPRH